MMQLTPSAKSSFIAGMGLAVLGWMTALHIDALADLFKVSRWVRKDAMFEWINTHKVLTLLLTEFCNYGAHGISSSDSVTFAGGATVMNSIFIFVLLPIRMAIVKRRRNKPVLLRRAA